jgi:hypothetical protein
MKLKLGQLAAGAAVVGFLGVAGMQAAGAQDDTTTTVPEENPQVEEAPETPEAPSTEEAPQTPEANGEEPCGPEGRSGDAESEGTTADGTASDAVYAF